MRFRISNRLTSLHIFAHLGRLLSRHGYPHRRSHGAALRTEPASGVRSLNSCLMYIRFRHIEGRAEKPAGDYCLRDLLYARVLLVFLKLAPGLHRNPFSSFQFIQFRSEWNASENDLNKQIFGKQLLKSTLSTIITMRMLPK